MAKGDSCEVCGGSDMNLVDGFYYCMECGTQDKNIQETVLDVQALADGTFTTATKHKIRAKVKEGVEMSSEWYKWHSYNFILVGLADELVALGAAPSFKMKLLWIWSRYIKMYQKKEEMGKSHILSQLESSESEDSAASATAADSGGVQLHRPSRLLLLALLQLALDHDRSRMQPSDLLRLVKYRLLSLNDMHKFVPEEIDIKKVEGYSSLRNSLVQCAELPRYSGRLAARLRLGGAPPPDLEALLAARLAELCLPRALRRLVLALLARAPAPCRPVANLAAPAERAPGHEAVLMAYVVVALKLCLGLDDEREARLSAVAEAVSEREGRRRAYRGEPAAGPRPRLFSFREWCAHMEFRELALCSLYAPLAWERGRLADDYAFVEHFEAFDARPAGRPRRRRADVALGDDVTMRLLERLPPPPAPVVLPRQAARCLATATPLSALADAAAPLLPPAARRRLAEDFTRYDLDYAFRRLELRDAAGRDHVAGGVGPAGKTFREDLGLELLVERSERKTVHVRNCENRNWVRTEPRILAADESLDDAAPDDDEPADGGREPETFVEEEPGRDIFDDDFMDVQIKEEAAEHDDDARYDPGDDTRDGTRDDTRDGTRDDTRDGTRDDIEPLASWEHDGGAFDSDDEAPKFDPTVFDRREIIRRIMVEAYREHRMHLPLKFRTDETESGKNKRERTRRPKTSATEVRRPRTRDHVAAVSALLGDLRRARARGPSPAPEEARAHVSDAASVASGGERPVELIENDLKENDADSSDSAAHDPVPAGDPRFDADTHDARRLYVRLRSALGAGAGGADPELARLLEEKVAKGAARKQNRSRKAKPERFRRNLVDDPEGVPEFYYWFKRYAYADFSQARKYQSLEKEMDSSFPRSFRLVLRWCAAAAALRPGEVYRHVMEIERRALRLCQRPPPPIRPRDEDKSERRERAAPKPKRKSELAGAHAADTQTAKRKKKDRHT